MAKRTKIAIENKTVETTNDVVLETPSTTLGENVSVINNNTNTKNECTSEAPDELEQFTIVKNNIVKSDDYIKFIELASKYNLFNKIELSMLCKADLISLIGAVVTELYLAKDALHKMMVEDANRKQTSFDKPVSYTDLMGTLGNYKSWN